MSGHRAIVSAPAVNTDIGSAVAVGCVLVTRVARSSHGRVGRRPARATIVFKAANGKAHEVASGNRQRREARETAARLKRYEARQELHDKQIRRRVRDNVIAVAGVVAIVAVAGFAQFGYFTSGPGAPTPEPTATAGESDPTAEGQNFGAPSPDLAENREWTGTFTFNDVTIDIALDGLNAPQAVAGFVRDLGVGYYPGKNCHRLAGDLAFLQCGSLDGQGGPDPAFSYGPVENAPLDDVYPAGTIAMARQGDLAYSFGHQFFIVLNDVTLPADSAGGYTVVGTVTQGLDQLAALVANGVDPTTAGPDGSGFPVESVQITGFSLQ